MNHDQFYSLDSCLGDIWSRGLPYNRRKREREMGNKTFYGHGLTWACEHRHCLRLAHNQDSVYFLCHFEIIVSNSFSVPLFKSWLTLTTDNFHLTQEPVSLDSSCFGVAMVNPCWLHGSVSLKTSHKKWVFLLTLYIISLVLFFSIRLTLYQSTWLLFTQVVKSVKCLVLFSDYAFSSKIKDVNS